MTNFEKLDAAITYGVEHPEEFDMNDWMVLKSCGTTACLAGTAAHLNGWKPTHFRPLDPGDPDDSIGFAYVTKGGVEKVIEHVGRDELGLTQAQADDIFYADDIAEVIQIRNAYARAENVPERIWQVPVKALSEESQYEHKVSDAPDDYLVAVG